MMTFVIGLISMATSNFIRNSSLPKNRQKCIQKIAIANGKITHNFFDFQKFCAKLSFFTFIASIIQENTCQWSIITMTYKNHVLSSKG